MRTNPHKGMSFQEYVAHFFPVKKMSPEVRQVAQVTFVEFKRTGQITILKVQP